MSTTQHIRRIVLDIDADDVTRYSTWQPCTRVRLIPAPDGTSRLEVDTRELCGHCRGSGEYHRDGFWLRCRYCRGTGLR